MDGQCARVTCANPASVLLVFDPRTTWASLRDYDPDDRVVGIHLCDDHAEVVTVPDGWSLTDERTGAHRLAAVPAESEPESSVSESSADAQDDDGVEAEGPADETSEDEVTPTLWPVEESEPIDELEVDESTPMLSRAFRAAHVD